MTENEITWQTTSGDRVEIFEDASGEWRFHVRARNGEVVEQGESHPARHVAVTAALRHHPRVEEPNA